MTPDTILSRIVDSLVEKSAEPLNTTDPETTREIETTDHVVEDPAPPVLVSVGGITKNSLFRHPDAHPVVLDLLLIQKYEIEWLEWEPETISLRIPQDFGTTLSTANYNKINAIKTLHLVDSFWNQWESFIWCTMGLNGLIPNAMVLQVPTVAQVLVSVDIANRVRTDTSWSEEVKTVIKAVYSHDGIFHSLPPADFVYPEAEGIITDTNEIEEKWAAVRASGKAPEGDDVVSEQLRRLLVANNYLEESREHLQYQLRLVSRG